MTRANDIARGYDFSTGIDAGEVLPHIIPDVLYPSYVASGTSNKLLDGTTAHSGAFGTAQSDGRKYYYTNIAGSKPIKDPRIGAHFGSQRYQTSSLQLLEQETATQGHNVYSVDGREWMRAFVADLNYASNGHQLRFQDPTHFIEIVGYFNGANIKNEVEGSNTRAFEVKVDGVVAHSARQTSASVGSPLINRYVDSGSIQNIDLTSASSLSSDTTLGIHTLKLKQAGSAGAENISLHGIELIAQDTTSTANKSKIQIPAQNVVSYGKKFAIPATAQHYNPFDGMSGAKTLAQLADYIDTGTSLGMENWKGGTSNYHKPFNGGRVVKWVDSSGTIKTSVTMMPPNAQNIGGTASNAVSNAHIIDGTNDDTINFDTTTIANATPLSEVAKTFHWREFGNGSANGGTGHANYADLSMVSTAPDSNGDEVAYVMDDGLTSMSTDHAYVNNSTEENNTGIRIAVHTGVQNTYFTFIGTGFSAELKKWSSVTFDAVGNQTLVQNLPYGTHIVKIARDNSGTDQVTLTVDGVAVQVEATGVDDNALETLRNLTFHQPKMPPIPEDAVVISDFMLMADFVAQGAEGIPYISKGVRSVSCSRDVFYEQSAGTALNFSMDMLVSMGFLVWKNALNGTHKSELPYFGTDFVVHAYDASARAVPTEYINSTSLGTITYTGSAYTEFATTANTPTLGLNGIRTSGTTDAGLVKFDIASPIHTSSHYQTFETPFLHELVGGDRNMEQNNLIVTPDGKTWDEVTRDTSYIGNIVVRTEWAAVGMTFSLSIGDEFRGTGTSASVTNLMNKDFAIAYDRLICLKGGQYQVYFQTHENSDIVGSDYCLIKVNGQSISLTYQYDSAPAAAHNRADVTLKRGDYVQLFSAHWSTNAAQFGIIRL